jgi:hypothetical protein
MNSMALKAAAKRNKPKFPSALFVRCPPSLPEAVARGADRAMTSVSAYVRGAVLERLARDGVDVNARHFPSDGEARA